VNVGGELAMKKRILKFIFLAFELVFVVFVIIYICRAKLINFSQTDWVTLLVGLGDSIAGWITLFKRSSAEKLPASMVIKTDRGSPQIILGDNGRNIQTKTYVEKQYNNNQKK
jgi:hypothetical protein